MLYLLQNGEIRLTRGDSATLTVDLTDSVTGEEYTLPAGAYLKMGVRKDISNPDSVSYVFLKSGAVGSNSIKIDPDDTNRFAPGDYYYDIQIVDGNEIYTVTDVSKFVILNEVTI